MNEKDLTEKLLEDYNDVFADIINGFLFKGKQVVSNDELINSNVHSQYKADDNMLHELERDVAKYWKKKGICLALYNLENQTVPDKSMPIRVIGYEGASYRSMLNAKTDHFYPVVTVVLYFGTKTRWTGPTTLKELLDIPDEIKDYVNDCKINVCEVAWLTEEEINMFHSDFRIVADFFRNVRINPNYVPNNTQTIEHVDEMIKLLGVLTKDQRYLEVLKEQKDGGIVNMCDVAERLERNGMAKGMAKGMVQGEENLADAIRALKSGVTKEELLSKGFNPNTIKLAEEFV